MGKARIPKNKNAKPKVPKIYVHIDAIGGQIRVEKDSEEHYHFSLVKKLTDLYPQYVIRGSTTGLKLKASQIPKVKPYACIRGEPDVVMYAPVVDVAGKLIYSCLQMELKRAKVGAKKEGTVKATQEAVMNKLALTGRCYCAAMVSDLDVGLKHSLEIVENYLDPKKHHLLKKKIPDPLKIKKPRVVKQKKTK